MSLGLDYLREETKKLEEELKRISVALDKLEEDKKQDLLKQQKKKLKALSLMNDMVEVRKIEECHHVYIMLDESEEDSSKLEEYPYCIKCKFDSSSIFTKQIKSVKDAKIRSLCTNLGFSSVTIPKGLYLKNSKGYIHCNKDDADEIYQGLIAENSNIDDATLGIRFMEKLKQKKLNQTVKKKNKI